MENNNLLWGRQGCVERMRLCGILGKGGYTGQLYLCYLSTSLSVLSNFSFGMEKHHQTQNILMDLFHSAILNCTDHLPEMNNVNKHTKITKI